MYATLGLLDKSNYKSICFKSYRDAKRFKRFVRVFIEEIKKKNDYDFYWVSTDVRIKWSLRVPRLSENNLKETLIKEMLHLILVSRTGKRIPDIEVEVSLKKIGKVVSFKIGKLPKRIKS